MYFNNNVFGTPTAVPLWNNTTTTSTITSTIIVAYIISSLLCHKADDISRYCCTYYCC